MTRSSTFDAINSEGNEMSASEQQRAVIAQRLASLFGEAAKLDSVGNEMRLRCKVDDLLYVLKTVRDDPILQFKQLSDLTAVDYPEQAERFEVIYQMLSIALNARLRIVTTVADGAILPTAIDLFASANWAEREVWDMFGIFFSGHPDLRRLLTDYGFEGHPLRKDFPLTGYVEVRYNDTERRVVYEPVKLTQEYRNFDFLSPWEGMHVEEVEMNETNQTATDKTEGEG